MPSRSKSMTYRNSDGHEITATITATASGEITADLSEPTVTAIGGYALALDGRKARMREFRRILDASLRSEGYERRGVVRPRLARLLARRLESSVSGQLSTNTKGETMTTTTTPAPFASLIAKARRVVDRGPSCPEAECWVNDTYRRAKAVLEAFEGAYEDEAPTE